MLEAGRESCSKIWRGVSAGNSSRAERVFLDVLSLFMIGQIEV